MKRLAVVLVTYNREDFVGRCIASIARAASPALHIRIVAMDNGSTDGTPAALAEAARALPENVVLDIIRTEDNRPVPGTYNRGFEAAYQQPSDYAMMMNDDTEFEDDGLLKLIAACDAYPDSMLVPLQMNYREPQHMDATMLRRVSKMDDLVEDAVLGRTLKQVYPQRTLGAAAMIGRTALWQQIGEWDETFFFYGVDDDYCKRARHHGYETYLVPESRIFHAHGKLGARVEEQNKAGYRAKWIKETQARYWFLVKEPEGSFEKNYARMRRQALLDAAECLVRGWPWGAWQSLVIYLWFARRRDALKATRARHFPAR